MAFALQACGGSSGSSSGIAALATTQAVAYQIDVAHSGVAPMPGASFPVDVSWRVQFSDDVSYPLIAEGKVFVLTEGSSSGSNRTQLYALDEQSGKGVWGPVDIIASPFLFATHAYDAGRLFVINFAGVLHSFDAATGVPGWSVKLPTQYAFTAPPTASQGKVFVAGAGSGGTVYAVDQKSGTLLWTRSIQGGADNSPTIGPHGVVVSYMCQTYSFAPENGATVWQIDLGCFGPGGPAAPYSGGNLYVRDFDFSTSRNSLSVRDESTGALIATRLLDGLPMSSIPAVASGAVYLQDSGTLRRWDSRLQTASWSFAGDGTLSSTPIVVGPYVVVGGTSGKLYAVDAISGSLHWSAQLPASVNVSSQPPLTGLAAGEGYLVVPAGHSLSAWRLVAP